MSLIIQLFPILALFIFLDYSIHTYVSNFPTPLSTLDNYEYYHSTINLRSHVSTHSPLKLRKQAFGSVNTVMTTVIVVLTILNIVVYKLREFHEANLREKYKPSQQSCRRFLLSDILSATIDFNESLVVGEGGFGKVYRGVIDDGTVTVAMKRLNPWSKQGAPEFWSEIEMLSKIRHTNIVSLIGYCDDCDEMILVYDYMVHGTLAGNVHQNRRKSSLLWAQRLRICIQAARGLDYLHTGIGDQKRIIHRDVKSSNILLGENWTAKVSDFGLSKIGPANQLQTHVSTNVKGTSGYIDPEYCLTHQLTRKSDVYAFGVVLFEVLCGRRAVDLSLDVEQRGLAGWAQDCIKEGKLNQIIDPCLEGQILPDSLTVFAQIADQCLHMFSTKRPTMAEVVVALEVALTKQERTDFSIYEDEFSINAGDDLDIQENAESSIKEDAVIKESPEKVRRAPAFTKTVWKFFFGTGHVTTDGVEQRAGYGRLKRFAFSELQLATHDFNERNVVRQEGFGKVYKGILADNTEIAVKRFIDRRGKLQFQTEIEVLNVVVHRNIVQLLGFCMTKKERLLVFPFMQNLAVSRQLREIQDKKTDLDWQRRKKVALGTARGLEYLHEHCQIIHRDVKGFSILLNNDFEAVIGNFGLGRLMDMGKIYTASDVRGTFGYISPEYLTTGKASVKNDVFGYGFLLFELITRKRAFDLVRIANDHGAKTVVDHVKKQLREKGAEKIVDTNLQKEYNIEEVEMMIQLALLCIQGSPEDRPAMSEVVQMLEGQGLATNRWDNWQNTKVTRSLRDEKLQRSSDLILDCSISTQHAVELSGGR